MGRTLFTGRQAASRLAWTTTASSSVSPLSRALRRSLFISTSPTPNPSALKFSPGVAVAGTDASHHFGNARDALKSPLATELFAIEGVTVVFFGPDFVSVTKEDAADWAEIKGQVFDVLLMHFSNPSSQLLHDMTSGPSDTLVTEEDDEVVAMIKELLATRIRPGVQMDGGDVVYRGFTDGIVLLQLQGACSSCPSSSVTLHNSIQRMLMHWIPEVSGVMAVEDDDLAKINLEAFTNFEAKKAAEKKAAAE